MLIDKTIKVWLVAGVKLKFTIWLLGVRLWFLRCFQKIIQHYVSSPDDTPYAVRLKSERKFKATEMKLNFDWLQSMDFYHTFKQF